MANEKTKDQRRSPIPRSHCGNVRRDALARRAFNTSTATTIESIKSITMNSKQRVEEVADAVLLAMSQTFTKKVTSGDHHLRRAGLRKILEQGVNLSSQISIWSRESGYSARMRFVYLADFMKYAERLEDPSVAAAIKHSSQRRDYSPSYIRCLIRPFVLWDVQGTREQSRTHPTSSDMV